MTAGDGGIGMLEGNEILLGGDCAIRAVLVAGSGVSLYSVSVWAIYRRSLEWTPGNCNSG